MAKKMLSAAPGVLQKLMALQNVNQMELASEIGVDVKTLRAVMRGGQVKETTLKRFALKLGRPLEHLLTDIEAIVSEQNENDSGELDSRDHVSLKQTSSETLRGLLVSSAELSWFLDLPGLSAEASDQLLCFETLVKDWHGQLLREPWFPIPERGLRAQIKLLEAATEIERQIGLLAAKYNIRVFGGQYSRWERTERRDPYEEQLLLICYDSVPVAVIAFRPTSATTAKVWANRGELPPKRFHTVPVPVQINGQEVWDGERFGPFSDTIHFVK